MKVKEMTPLERSQAALAGEKVDCLSTYPLACGVCRRLVGDGKMTYKDWVSDPKKFASAFIEAQKEYKMDLSVGLMDLSVMAGDMGAHVRMDEQNTPFVDEHMIHSPEDYEKLEVPDITKGRTNVLIQGSKLANDALGKEVTFAAFVEGPLLALSQYGGAEQLFMDMFSDPEPVHKALKVTTEYCKQIANAMGENGIKAICWDTLWGNYATLGDAEYGEFEGNTYFPEVEKVTASHGMANCIHNCADLPHLKTQILDHKPALYSMAYYPLIDGSPSPTKVIEDGYADHCLIAGDLDPQIFMRDTPEQCAEATKNLCQEVKTALCKRGINSQYCISSGCEIPPSVNCRLEDIKAVVDTERVYGQMEYRAGKARTNLSASGPPSPARGQCAHDEGDDMTNMFYERLRTDYGISYNTTASVRKFKCPRCGFEFSLAYARAITCQGCSEAVKGCRKVRCGKCDYEWPLSGTPDVQNANQEKTLADHICGIVNQRDDGRGIVVYNRRLP